MASERMWHEWGLRAPLISYNSVVEARGTHTFWIEARRDHMKLYAELGKAKNCDHAPSYDAGLRNVLLSYAFKATDDSFWLDREQREEIMKLYVAGNTNSSRSSERDYENDVRNRLLSYAFKNDWAKQEFEFWIQNNPSEASVFLDSGAFSAFTLGRQIDLGEYCEYVKENAAALAAYAVLDVIGDSKATRKALLEMRARGLNPVPIFHAGEPLAMLTELLNESDYIAFGGLVARGYSRDQMRQMLDTYFAEAERFWPVKIHGLGVSAQWAIERYPFFSVDSSSAILGAGMGRVSRLHGPDQMEHGPDRSQLTSAMWVDDTAVWWDAVVADGVGRTAAKEGGSESAHEGRRKRNIQSQLKMEQQVTALWAHRGVTW